MDTRTPDSPRSPDPIAHRRAGPVGPLLVAGLTLGVIGDTVLRVPGPPGLNMSLWIASIALAASLLHRRAGLEPDEARSAWLTVAVLLAAGLAWRDAPTLRLLALGGTTVAFALAAYRRSGSWVRRAGVTRYAVAWMSGALHAWTASLLVLLDARQAATRLEIAGRASWRRAGAVARGLVLAAPFLVIFGVLLMSADDVFADLVLRVVRVDVEWVGGHLLLFAICAWLATGYLRGFLTGTDLAFLQAPWRDGVLPGIGLKRPALSITEGATALAAIDALFLAFVIVQFRYLFGGDALVQVTPGLTYAEYARLGFFELVVAVALVVPLLLAADWLVTRDGRREEAVFRVLAGIQIALVLAIAASALHRLRLYDASYGLTESRFNGMVVLVWMGAMLLWFGATVLRGRRRAFAFGALIAGLTTIALLFVANPDAIVARRNVARLASADAAVRFDVAYATTLSADAVPLLLEALPTLPPDVQCPLAAHLLRQWPPAGERRWLNWNWSAARAAGAVREQAARLQAMAGPNQPCAESGVPGR